jgi:hypothetical protein
MTYPRRTSPADRSDTNHRNPLEEPNVRKLPVKIATAAGALVLAGAVVAGADDTPPDAADDGLSTAVEASGQETLPVRAEADDTDADAVEVTDTDTDAEDGDEVEEAEVEGTEEEADTDDAEVTEQNVPNGEHGAEVTAVARPGADAETTDGNHGEAVREVASSKRQNEANATDAKADDAGDAEASGDDDDDESTDS